MALLRSVLLRSVELRWVRQQQVPILMAPLAAITLIPRATEAPRMMQLYSTVVE